MNVYGGHDPFTLTGYYNHWFSMELIYLDGKFNWVLSGFDAYENFDDLEPLKHGAWVQFDPQTYTHEFLSHGFRNPGGIGIGPDNTFICLEYLQ